MTDTLIARLESADGPDVAATLWEEMIREEAQGLADRDNSCDACCGSYGTATWKEYEQQVRDRFEEIGNAFTALAAAALKARGV